MATEKHGTAPSNKSEVELPTPTPRVSESFKTPDSAWMAPDNRLPERKIDGADPDK